MSISAIIDDFGLALDVCRIHLAATNIGGLRGAGVVRI